MKKLFLLLAVFGLMFSACTEGGGIEDDNGTTEQPGGSGNNGSDDGEKPEDIFFALDKEEITIKPDGGSAEVVVYSNYKWDISGTSDWCTPSVVSGEANEDGQTVTFSADVAYDDREAIFWFSCADKAIKLVVKQNLKEVIIADNNNTFDVPAEGGTIEIAYQTSVECEVIIPDEAKDWITLAPETKGLVSEKVNLIVAENTTYEARSAVIKVVKRGDSTLCAEYTVNQKQNDAFIADDNNTFDVPAEGGNIEIAYQTNVECEVIIPDEAKEWITIVPVTKGLVSEKVNLNVAENKTYEARSAVIKVVKKGDNTSYAEYTVNQKQNDAIITDNNNTFEIPAKGGNIALTYQTNVECEVIIPDEAKEWITIAPKTRGLVSEKTTLTVAANITEAARSAVIKVVAVGNEKLMAEYIINQAHSYILNYTSSNGIIVTPYRSDAFGATILVNEYKDGVGYLVFNAPVTAIGSYAFDGCSSLTSITIPDSVTTIGSYAFRGCSSLTSVTIPDSVTEIGSSAFHDCIFEKNNFINNSSLDAEQNGYWGAKVYDVIQSDGLCINGTTVVSCRRNATSVTIPNSVTEIGNKAFYYCCRLTSVTIPDSVTEVGDSAFWGCSSLTSVTIGNGVTTIGSYAFYDCSSLTDTYVNITDLAAYATNNNTHRFPGNKHRLVDGVEITELVIPDGVTSIGSYAFYDCSSLTDTYVNITDLAAYATNNNTHRFPGNKHRLVDGVEITELVIPDGVTSIGSSAFDGCSSLTSVTIPDSVTSIGWSAFSGCI